uniref:Uncharacterized protein n=1 Tax=Anguilla anguilla TaxID=7936 RepID=A0A0E9XVK4_ANGAN
MYNHNYIILQSFNRQSFLAKDPPQVTLHYITGIWQTLLSRVTYNKVAWQNLHVSSTFIYNGLHPKLIFQLAMCSQLSSSHSSFVWLKSCGPHHTQQGIACQCSP